MGWFVFVLLTLVSAASSYVGAARLLRDRSTLERLVAAFILWCAGRLVAMQVTGYVGLLRPWPLGLASLLVDVGVVLAARARWKTADLYAIARHDCAAPLRALKDVVRSLDPIVIVVLPAVGALVVMILTAWYFRSWTWDGLWYHTPITHFAVQDGTLAFPNIDDHYIQGYPRNIELLAAWGCIFQRDSRLEDAVQIPFGVLGSLVAAAWARRAGAARPLALGIGAAWLAIPSVYVELPTSYNDVACASLFVVAFFFLTGKFDPRDLAIAMVAFGLYVGSKFSGLFHLALIGPFVALRFGRNLVVGPRRLSLALHAFAGAVLALAVSAPKYLQNWAVTHNPMWPFRMTLPILGHFPGPEFVQRMYDAPEGATLAFFGQPGDVDRTISSWGFVWPHCIFTPDVRQGGFGAVFRWLLVPCVVIVAGDVMRQRDLRRALPVVALFIASMVVPAPWWPRYTFGAAIAGLVAFAIVRSATRSRAVRCALGAAFAFLVLLDCWRERPGVYQSPFPRLYAEARRDNDAERSAIAFETSLWPQPWALARETQLRPGDVVAFDESVLFLGDYFSHDYRTRVLYVPSTDHPETYVARLRQVHARWAGVRVGSTAEALLLTAGGTRLFQATDTAIWQTPWGAPLTARALGP